MKLCIWFSRLQLPSFIFMMRVFDGNVNSKKKPFCKDKCLKGILRRNIELFLKKPIEEKLGISQIKQVNFFFPFLTVFIFYFC